MKVLNEKNVIDVMREEWNKRVRSLVLESNENNTPVKVGGVDKFLSPELKLIHKKSRLKYTIDSVSAKSVVLRNPEGETFTVDSTTLEHEYNID